ncbi:MAG: single-stranded DNA-binding protein [Bacillota bacterium]
MQNSPTQNNNCCFISGLVCSPPMPSHSIYGEGFYRMEMEVPRLSRQVDVLPVTVSERLLGMNMNPYGKMITVEGQLRSYNKMVDGRSRLIISVFARSLYRIDHFPEDPNRIMLEGYVCKPPIYRTTPFHREITDMLLAVNRAYEKSDYIPCICWGHNARISGQIPVGTRVCVNGRIQSRDYDKQLENGEIQKRRVYEVSVRRMAIVEEP